MTRDAAHCAHVWRFVENVVALRVTLRGVAHREAKRYHCPLCGSYETRIEQWTL